ncbi:MAG TPA: hypothetical protein ENH70_08010 [Desulfobacteraceae bacterium]|nr:MAG: hypothetical protein DRG82_02210 [Deltaproteobacteria bacterium]HDZ24465.1 hypothetical protein [Desulfobacteraceae bacterium]
MEIDAAHKALLKEMGLKEEDFALFDEKFVRYEFDAEKGVRLYDPYYSTSYNEYIGIDGWSAWSSENDTFQTDILKKSRERLEKKKGKTAGRDNAGLGDALRKKFPERAKPDPT